MPRFASAAATLLLLSVPAGAAGPVPQQTKAVTSPVTVPEGNGAPVITDGIFSPGEWEDARRITLAETVALYVKHYRGVVFVGVRGRDIGPSDLFVAAPGGPIQQLHVSAQLFENVVAATGEQLHPRFGLTPDWYANELRRDEEEAARLRQEHRDLMEIIRATSYPSDGIEFAIRRSKFPGRRWLMRLHATGFFGGKPGKLIYPAAAAERTTAGWLELRFSK